MAELVRKLFAASAAGKLDRVKAALAGGADLQQRDEEDNTAVMVALLNRRDEVFCYLLEQGGQLGPSKEVERERQQRRAELGSEKERKELDEELYRASERSEYERVVQAVDKGATIDYRGEHGWTPLMTALFDNRPHVSLYLLAQGADVELTNKVMFDCQPAGYTETAGLPAKLC